MKITSRKFLNVKTPTCHASTVVSFRGRTVFAWFGGVREGLADSTIFIQFGSDKKSNIYMIGADNQMARWNPILFEYQDRLYIFVKAGDFCDRWQTFLYDITNINESKENISVQLIPAGLNGPVKTKPIVDEKTGLIYCGSSVETRFDWSSYIEVYKMNNGKLDFIYRTPPLVAPKNTYVQGFTQKVSNGIIQPSLWMDNDRKIHAFFRSSTGLEKLYYSNSKLMENEKDFENFVWTAPTPIEHLNNPNSGVDTVFYNDRLFLVYNPDTTYRIPLTLAELDYKNNFKIIDSTIITQTIPLEETTYSKELSYPYMIEKDGTLLLSYTYGRSSIEYIRIKI